MQLVNKERQRKIRHELLTEAPNEGTPERETYDLNRTASPLLRLPPELRNRIYELVLSVGQINVCYKKWSHKNHTTRSGQRTTETVVEGGFYCRILPKTQDPWKLAVTSRNHSGAAAQGESSSDTKTTKYPQGMTLLSSASRQLYNETVLLPYALNVWSFESNHVMERLLLKEKRLPVLQRRAIRILYTPSVLTVAVEKALGSLEVLLLQGGVRMTRVVIEKGEGDASGSGKGKGGTLWEVEHRWWGEETTRATGSVKGR
ncbi:hypothetical protein B0T16DRAFT_334305 [Cercophora newfieldiana]|uniref:DUF7730 domain-containing protein n=1 Tax=Cercophora newfieldiana TaxID=92897 RepID=A0AA39XXE8_9PEZI|nr:hypothetical protein B0T16DRAFT_334305 [Cercophora newfieldiana]